MQVSFIFVFWIAVLIISIISFIYSLSAQGQLETFENRIDIQGGTQSIVVGGVRIYDVLTAVYVFIGIAILLELLVLVLCAMYGICRFYGTPVVIWLVYVFFVFWFVLTLIGVSFSANEISTNAANTSFPQALSIVERDLAITQITIYAILVLLVIGFVAYIYMVNTSANFYLQSNVD